jgi:hypothetical protein
MLEARDRPERWLRCGAGWTPCQAVQPAASCQAGLVWTMMTSRPWAVGRGPWPWAVDVALTLTLAVSLAVTHIVINSHASHLGRITPHRSPSP